jgi:predicted nuclease with TOPRIM domain
MSKLQELIDENTALLEENEQLKNQIRRIKTEISELRLDLLCRKPNGFTDCRGVIDGMQG